jgi:DNA-binding CsgD family transcriptional regulator
MVAGTAQRSPSQAGSLWVSDEGELLFASPSARKLLERLRTSDSPRRAAAALGSLAARAIAPIRREAEGRPSPVSMRVRATDGDWISLHAERIRDADGSAGGVGIVIGPAHPGEVFPMLVEAYRLSPREQEIARAVLTGQSTKEISNRLHISSYTVQDHLKSIFDKVGVRSRRQLVHHLAHDFS